MDEYRTTVDALLKRQTAFELARTDFEAIWQEIADRIIPRKGRFTRRNEANQTKGKRLTDRIFDAVPALALDRYAAAVHSLVVPRNQIWHKLKSPDAELNKLLPVRRYFEDVNARLFSARYSAGFDNQVHECFYDHGAFATTAIYVGKRYTAKGARPTYRSIPLHQGYFAENADGIVDLFHRKYPLTARQALQEFDEAMLPDAIKRAAKDSAEREFTFLHVCQPNVERDVSRMDRMSMPVASYDLCIDTRTMVAVGGHHAFPYAVSRYSSAPGEVYGRGPAEIVLPDVKMLNEMNKTTLQAAQLKTLPPLLSQRSGVLDGLRLTPGAINHGGVSPQGQQLVHPLQLGGDVGIGIDLMDQKRKIVQDAFWNTLFQILVETPTMTATEAMLRAQEKGVLLAPTASRIESEFLQRIVEAEWAVMEEGLAMPEPPGELLEAAAQEGGDADYEIEYDSPMSRARSAEKGIGMLRTWEQLTPLAEATQGRVFKRFNMDKSAQILAEVNGYPAEAIYTDDEMAALDAQDQQQQAVAAAIQAAEPISAAAKNLAQAQALSGAQPGTSPVPV